MVDSISATSGVKPLPNYNLWKQPEVPKLYAQKMPIQKHNWKISHTKHTVHDLFDIYVTAFFFLWVQLLIT